MALFALRSSPAEVIGLSPHELLTGRKMPCPSTNNLISGEERELASQEKEIADYVQQLQNLAVQSNLHQLSYLSPLELLTVPCNCILKLVTARKIHGFLECNKQPRKLKK